MTSGIFLSIHVHSRHVGLDISLNGHNHIFCFCGNSQFVCTCCCIFSPCKYHFQMLSPFQLSMFKSLKCSFWKRSVVVFEGLLFVFTSDMSFFPSDTKSISSFSNKYFYLLSRTGSDYNPILVSCRKLKHLIENDPRDTVACLQNHGRLLNSKSTKITRQQCSNNIVLGSILYPFLSLHS